jgi:hypothetical protein
MFYVAGWLKVLASKVYLKARHGKYRMKNKN